MAFPFGRKSPKNPKQTAIQNNGNGKHEKIDWKYVLSELNELGNVFIEFPDGPTLDGSTFPGKYELSNYFYSSWELPNSDLVRTLQQLGFAFFKHAVHVSFVGKDGRQREDRVNRLKEYFGKLPEEYVYPKNYPVSMRFFHTERETDILFLQHYLMHVPMVEALDPLPASSPIAIYNPQGVDNFFGELKRAAEQMGYETVKVEKPMVQYVKPHVSYGIQPPLFLDTPELYQAKREPLVSLPQYRQLPLSEFLPTQKRLIGFGDYPGAEPNVLSTDFALEIYRELGHPL